jgi:tetrapyrrole methylase family protein/MazG family protein
MTDNNKNINESFGKLVELMDRLRDPGGCPWDREQTKQTIKPCVLEETYEVLEAIDDPNPESLKEELGDLLFQVIFLARLAKEKGEYDITDVLEQGYAKLYNRHPHVFGDVEAHTSDDVLKNWEKIKAVEKKHTRQSILDGLPETLPALLKAQRIQERASRVGFDWNHIDPAMEKVSEELDEFKEAIKEKDVHKMEDELGDVFFALVNVSRFLKVNSEVALQGTIKKFTERFQYIEKESKRAGKSMQEMTLDEMDVLWNEAKKLE